MLSGDSLIVELMQRANALVQRSWMRQDDPVEVLRDPGFEQFLSKINQGVALCSSSEYFYYVSKSMVNLLGYPLKLIYDKGPSFFQQLIIPDERASIRKIIGLSENALKNTNPTHTVRFSFDYHIISGKGDVKRIYQHTLPASVVHEKKFYTLLILSDLSGFKTSRLLNYRVSSLTANDEFQTIAEGEIGPSVPYRLTKREVVILNMLGWGKNMNEIADTLFISTATLKKHRSNILRKAGARNMAALIDHGLRQGWLSVEEADTSRTKHVLRNK